MQVLVPIPYLDNNIKKYILLNYSSLLEQKILFLKRFLKAFKLSKKQRVLKKHKLMRYHMRVVVVTSDVEYDFYAHAQN